MLSSKLAISIVVVVVVSVVVIGGMVLIRPGDHTVAAKQSATPPAQSAAQPPAMDAQTRKFFSGTVDNSGVKGY
jgi:flagellar basal body-associated protein FliL